MRGDAGWYAVKDQEVAGAVCGLAEDDLRGAVFDRLVDLCDQITDHL